MESGTAGERVSFLSSCATLAKGDEVRLMGDYNYCPETSALRRGEQGSEILSRGWAPTSDPLDHVESKSHLSQLGRRESSSPGVKN